MPGTAVPVVWSCRPHDKEPSDVTEENKDISRRWRGELDRKNWSALDEFVAPDVVMHFAGNPAPMDRDAMKPMLLTFYSASPGMHHTFEDQIAEGDKVTFRMTFRGTHQGEFQGIPPTGKGDRGRGHRRRPHGSGKMVEHWSNMDKLSLMQQLGVVPAPEPA